MKGSGEGERESEKKDEKSVDRLDVLTGVVISFSNITNGLNARESERRKTSCAIKEITNHRSRHQEMMSYRGNLFVKDNLAKRNLHMKSWKEMKKTSEESVLDMTRSTLPMIE